MASRRSLLQALVVLPVVGLLSRISQGASKLRPFQTYLKPYIPERVKAELVIEHEHPVSMAPMFQEAFEKWLREHQGYRPTGQMTFVPYAVDHDPWLVHPSWASLPDHGNPMLIFAPVGQAILCQRWGVIDLAWQLRLGAYWRELRSTPWANQPNLVREDFPTWRARQLKRLAYVVVRFDAVRA